MLLLSVVLFLVGCNGETEVTDEDIKKMAGGDMKETVPVSGTVLIGGSPAAGVDIYAYTEASGVEPAARTSTKPDGTYCWTTYKLCDGLVPGSYRLAFAHFTKHGKGNDEGEDALGGKYRNPFENEFLLEVKSAQPQTEVDYTLEK
ncbi:MAG: hypothetical protein KDA52_06520 [Planctomycetaceae bacterium]|nr:hypothetical protein [Planctomycetaceae bacterium]